MFAPSSLLLLPALGMRLGVESLDRRSESRCRVVRRGVDSARIAFAGIYCGAAGKHRRRSEDRVWGSRVDGERRETAMACWSEAFSRVVSNHSPMNEETSRSYEHRGVDCSGDDEEHCRKEEEQRMWI